MNINLEGATALSRRQLVVAGGSGIAALALGGLGFSNAPDAANALQFEATPPTPPQPATTSEAGESAADVAARLNYDAEAIFRFMADEINFESYPGMLRGSKGTLWARAGNSADQAVLLGELLTAAQIPWRFATAPTPAAHAEALTTLLSPTAEVAREHLERTAEAALLSAAGLEELPAEPPSLSEADQAPLDQTSALADRAFEEGGRSAAVSSAAISDTLAATGIDLPPLAAIALTPWEMSQHVWVQVADGPDWIDLDPSLPGAGQGTTSTEPASTFTEVPDEWNHQLTVRVVAEENLSGSLARRDVATLTTTSVQAVDSPIGISMAPAESIGGLGLGIDHHGRRAGRGFSANGLRHRWLQHDRFVR